MQVARLATLNAVSVGVTLCSLAGPDRGAEVLIAGWPDDESLNMLQLSRKDGERQYNVFRPRMEYLGIHYE